MDLEQVVRQERIIGTVRYVVNVLTVGPKQGSDFGQLVNLGSPAGKHGSKQQSPMGSRSASLPADSAHCERAVRGGA